MYFQKLKNKNTTELLNIVQISNSKDLPLLEKLPKYIKYHQYLPIIKNAEEELYKACLNISCL